MKTVLDTQYETHHVLISRMQQIYQVTIIENKISVMTNCSCGGFQKCMHVVEVLSGLRDNVLSESVPAQELILKRLNSTDSGRAIVARARQKLTKVNTCPSCHSGSVRIMPALFLKLKRTFIKRKVKKHKCLSCGLTW